MPALAQLPPRLGGMAILITARRWTAQYEWYAHYPHAIEGGFYRDKKVSDAVTGLCWVISATRHHGYYRHYRLL
jgi:hypothetical protein